MELTYSPLLLAAVGGLLSTHAPAANTSLELFGYATSAIDRVVVRLASSLPADLRRDFTIEFWMKRRKARNLGRFFNGYGRDSWISGNIIVDCRQSFRPVERALVTWRSRSADEMTRRRVRDPFRPGERRSSGTILPPCRATMMRCSSCRRVPSRTCPAPREAPGKTNRRT